jgi:hypothetical protein
MPRLLTPEQVPRYAELRGYGGGATGLQKAPLIRLLIGQSYGRNSCAGFFAA